MSPATPSFLTLKSVEEILALVRAFPPGPIEEAPLRRALGRILAEDFISPEDLPGFPRATVDGWAVRARDVFGASEASPALLDQAGECPMGQAPGLILAPGQAARIWTGGFLPEGAEAVVMLEYAREIGPRQVELTRPLAPGENVIQKGEDAARGQRLLAAGRFLRPQEIGLFAALGRETIPVRRKPRVAVISSGDEVAPVSEKPGPGQVRDINTYTLCAQAEAAGAEVRALGLAPDDPERLKTLLTEALTWAEVVLISGGSSVGQRDFTRNILAGLPGAEILVHGAAVSPGKPLILGRQETPQGPRSLWGLPGHPASALICGEIFLKPLFRQLLGREHRPPFWSGRLRARLGRPVASVLGRRDFIRVAVELPVDPDEPLVARPILGKSGLISTLVQADALVVCPENQEGLAAGELVELLW